MSKLLSQFAVRLDPELLELVREIAARRGQTPSDWIREAIASAAGRPDLGDYSPVGRPKNQSVQNCNAK